MLRALTLASLTSVAIASGARGAPELHVVRDTASPSHVHSNLQAATIYVMGFEAGQAVQGFAGTPLHPLVVTTTSPDGFWNDPGNWPLTDGNSPFAILQNLHMDAPPLDSGWLPQGGGSPFGNPIGDGAVDVAAFARFDSGANTIAQTFSMLSLEMGGVPVTSDTMVPVLQITWSRDHSASVGFTLVMNTPGSEHHFFVTIPPVPGPSALLAMLGLAGVLGLRVRRHCS